MSIGEKITSICFLIIILILIQIAFKSDKSDEHTKDICSTETVVEDNSNKGVSSYTSEDKKQERINMLKSVIANAELEILAIQESITKPELDKQCCKLNEQNLINWRLLKALAESELSSLNKQE